MKTMTTMLRITVLGWKTDTELAIAMTLPEEGPALTIHVAPRCSGN